MDRMTWGEFKKIVDQVVEDSVHIQWIDIAYPEVAEDLKIELQGATKREVIISDAHH